MITKLVTKYLHWLLLIFWIGIWASINTGPHNVIFYDKTLVGTLNAFRTIYPLLILALNLSLIIFIMYKKYNPTKRSSDKLTNLYLLLCISYIIALAITLNITDDPELLFHFDFVKYEYGVDYTGLNYFSAILFSRAWWMLSVLSVISIFYLLHISSLEYYYKHFFYASVVILGTFSFILTVPTIISFLNFPELGLYGNIFLDPSEGNNSFLNEPLPRTSGLSRMFLIIYIATVSVYYFGTVNKIKNYLLPVVLIVPVFIIGLQSRAMILSFILINVLIFALANKITLKKRIIFFLTFAVLPFIIFILLSKIISIDKNVPIKQMLRHIFQTDYKLTPPGKSEVVKISPYENLEMATSGRTLIWKKLISHSSKRPFFGYGPQADRYLLKNINYEGLKDNPEFMMLNTSASNGLVYAQVSAGLLGSLAYLGLCLLSVIKCLSLIFRQKIFENNDNIYIKSSVLIIIFLLLRSIIENSFMVYSIDFLLFVTCFAIINHHTRLITRNNGNG